MNSLNRRRIAAATRQAGPRIAHVPSSELRPGDVVLVPMEVTRLNDQYGHIYARPVRHYGGIHPSAWNESSHGTWTWKQPGKDWTNWVMKVGVASPQNGG